MFTWPGLQHDAWGARLPQSVLLLGAMPAYTTTQKPEKGLVIAASPALPGWRGRHAFWDQHWWWVYGAPLWARDEARLHAVQNIPRPQRTISLRWHHQTGRSCWRCSGIAKMYCSPNSSNVDTSIRLPRIARFWRNSVPPFAGNDQASSLKGCCCCMTMPVLILPIRTQRRWGHSSGKSSNIHLTAGPRPERFPLVWPFKTSSFGRTLSWRWCGWKSSGRVVPKATKRILRRRFPETCYRVGHVLHLYGDYVEK